MSIVCLSVSVRGNVNRNTELLMTCVMMSGVVDYVMIHIFSGCDLGVS